MRATAHRRPIRLLAGEQREDGLIDSVSLGFRQRPSDALACEPCPLKNSLRWDVANLDIGCYVLDAQRERIFRKRPRDFRRDSTTACARIEPVADLDDTSLRIKVVEGPRRR